MATDLTNITAAVAKAQTVGDSVLLLVSGLSSKIADLSAQPAAAIAAGDPAAQAAVQAELDALAASLSTQQDAVAAAVTANTPAA